MNSIVPKVAQLIESTPYKVQIAVNRQWEKAWKMNVQGLQFTEQDIAFFVGNEQFIVAVELFYKTKEQEDFYFGLQFSPELPLVHNPKDFLQVYLSLLQNTHDLSIGSILRELSLKLTGEEDIFFSGAPSEIDLGIVDFWQSFGPCTIWEQGQVKYIDDALLSKALTGHDNLATNASNYAGLEIVYRGKVKHWVSFQVSHQQEYLYLLDKQKIYKLLHETLDFTT